MKRLFICIVTLFCGLMLSYAHAQQSYGSYTATATGASTGINQTTGGINYHLLTWTGSGTRTSCTVALDSSVDGVTWTSGGAISGQNCAANGNSTVVAGTFNYVRINVTALTGAGNTVNVVYDGYTVNPNGGGGGDAPVRMWQNGLESSGSPTAFTAGDMALFYWDLPSISLAQIGLQISAGATSTWAVCLYPYTGLSATASLVAQIESTSWTAGDSPGFGAVPGAPVSLSAGGYWVGFVVENTAGITFAETGSFNGIGEPSEYGNYSFETGLSGSCPATITTPTAFSPTYIKVPWLALSAN